MFAACSLRGQACLIILLSRVAGVAELVDAMVDALQELHFLAMARA